MSASAQSEQYRLTTGDVAEQLGVHIATVQRWADDGEIAHIRWPGGARRFRPSDVDDFIARHREDIRDARTA